MKRTQILLFPFLLALAVIALEVSLLSGCAQIVAPTGGPRDTIPPQLDSAESTPNLQTNFQKQPIELRFEEFVQLSNVFDQVVVSPPLAFNPRVTVKKYKTVLFEFDDAEILRENATYIINFGDAIKDFTEGNIAPIRFIFSTGNYIDSLEVSGKVVDAVSGNPVSDVLVMLYDNLNDTVVRTERPFYFSRTDKAGQFKIENVKADTLKVFALRDSDPPNYLYDQDTEGIAFLDSFIMVSDSTPRPLTLSFFQPEPRLRLVDEEQPQHGLVKLSFNREPYDVNISYDDFGQYFYQETIKDTIRLWFDWSAEESFNLYVTADTLTDTILVQGGDRQALAASARLRLTNGLPGGRIQTLNPFKALELRFNRPIAEFDTSRIQLLMDSSRTPVPFSLQKDSLDPRLLFLPQPWKELLEYRLVVLPGGLTDVYGVQNDTIRQSYRIDEKKNYGNIALTLDQLDSTRQYVIRLMKGDKLIRSAQHQNNSIFKAEFKHLPPGEYLLDIIDDRNGNGRWDSGAYENYRPPENRYSKKLEPLRANWDLEATVSLEKSE